MLVVHESNGSIITKSNLSGVIGLAEHEKKLVLLQSDGQITTESKTKIDLKLEGDTVAISNGADDYAVCVNFDKENGKIKEGSQVQIIKL